MKVRELQYEIGNPYNRQARFFDCNSWEDYATKLYRGKAGISKNSISSFTLLDENTKFFIIGKFTAKIGLETKDFMYIAFIYKE